MARKKNHMREGVVVGWPTRGVCGEPVGSVHQLADIPLESPYKYTTVQNPPGAGSLDEREASMSNRPLGRPIAARESEDVRAVGETRPRGPLGALGVNTTVVAPTWLGDGGRTLAACEGPTMTRSVMGTRGHAVLRAKWDVES